jgi:hypothetical protein
MRQPTSPEQRWQWWEDAISGKPVETLENDIHCGFFKKRKFRYGEWTKGPWLPARVWMEQEIDPETGELLSDEVYRMEIDGKRVDPWKMWTWIARKPITEDEWKWLRAMSPLTPDKIPSR